jgi:hypothetical protein
MGDGSIFLHEVRLCHYYKTGTSFHPFGHQFIIKPDPVFTSYHPLGTNS